MITLNKRETRNLIIVLEWLKHREEAEWGMSKHKAEHIWEFARVIFDNPEFKEAWDEANTP